MKPISATFALQAHKLLQQGAIEQAIALCEQGLQVYPDYATAYRILAQAYELQSNTQRATEVAERGIQRMPLERKLLQLRDTVGSLAQQLHPAPSADSGNTPLSADDIGALFQTPQVEEAQEISDDVPVSDDDIDALLQAPQSQDAQETSDDVPVSNDDIDALFQAPRVEETQEISDDVPVSNDNIDALFQAPQVEEMQEISDDVPVSNDDIGTLLQAQQTEEVQENANEVTISDADAALQVIEQETEQHSNMPNEHELTAIPNHGDTLPVEEAEPVTDSPQLPSNTPTAQAPILQQLAQVESSPTKHAHLRIIESTERTDIPSLIWRSKNVRLIPGLEFTPLRFESKKDRLYKRMYKIPDPPPFPEFFAPQAPEPQRVQHHPTEPKGPLTPLEELARRLEAARIPRVEEEEHPLPPPTSTAAAMPMVSETIAKIYEMQGAWAEAIKAYEALAHQKPEQAPVYRKKIQELKSKL